MGGKQPESTGLKISGGLQELAFPSIKYQMCFLIGMVEVCCTQMPENCFN
jgi:hypothetical protein